MIILATTFTILIAGVVIFLLITLLLVGILLYVKTKLTPEGTVEIDINDGKLKLDVEPGNSLLSTLGTNKVFLPSACGGKGTCGMCRCQVNSGAGTILSTETGFFNRKEQGDNWRLACQIKVRETIKMHVKPEILGIKKWECTVASNENVATFIKEFIVNLPKGEILEFKSGGYIQIDVPQCEVDFKNFNIGAKYRPEWEKNKMFDLKMKNPEPTFRAYSMANHPAEGNIVMLNIRIATPPFDRVKGGFMNVNPGICSSYIYSLKPGNKITISGPYGEFFLKDNDNEMMFIGGGAGMAPMRSHLFHIFKTLKERNKKITFWYGARSLSEVFYFEEFTAIAKEFPNFTFNLALSDPKPEDNWTGMKGFIHQVIYDNYLRMHKEPEEINYYMCGPPMMNTAVSKMLYDLGVPDENIAYDDFGG